MTTTTAPATEPRTTQPTRRPTPITDPAQIHETFMAATNAHDVDALLALYDTDGIAVEHAFVEVELVDEAGAAPGLDCDAQPQVGAPFLLEEAADLACGDVGQIDLVRGQFVVVGDELCSGAVFVGCSAHWPTFL